jgi:hypothetical protein
VQAYGSLDELMEDDLVLCTSAVAPGIVREHTAFSGDEVD